MRFFLSHILQKFFPVFLLVFSAGILPANSKALSQKAQTEMKFTPNNTAPSVSGRQAETVILLLPFAFTATTDFGNGCWVRVFDSYTYVGPSRTLLGPLNLPHLQMPDGTDWKGQIDSMILGPQAQVTAFSQENFSGKEKVLSPGTKTQNLTALLNQETESMRLNCVGAEGVRR